MMALQSDSSSNQLLRPPARKGICTGLSNSNLRSNNNVEGRSTCGREFTYHVWDYEGDPLCYYCRDNTKTMEEYSSRPENQGGYRTRLILLWEDCRERKRSLNDQKRGKSLKERNDMGTAGKWSESHRLQRREWEKQYEREVRLVSGMNDSQQITTKSVAHSQTDQKNGISFGTMRPNTETFAVGFGDPLAAQNSSLSTHYTENLSWEITSGQSHYTQPINPGMEAGFNEMMVAGHSQSDCFGNLLPSDWSLFNPGVSNTGILSGSSIDFPNLNSDHDTYGNASQIVDMPEESFAGWQANDVIDFSLLDTQLEPDANPTPPEEQQGYEGYRSFR